MVQDPHFPRRKMEARIVMMVHDALWVDAPISLIALP